MPDLRWSNIAPCLSQLHPSTRADSRVRCSPKRFDPRTVPRLSTSSLPARTQEHSQIIGVDGRHDALANKLYYKCSSGVSKTKHTESGHSYLLRPEGRLLWDERPEADFLESPFSQTNVHRTGANFVKMWGEKSGNRGQSLFVELGILKSE